MNSEVITDDFLKNNYNIKCEGYGNYDGCYMGGYRYKLEISITNIDKDRTLACIMMNPSTTFPDTKWADKNWQKNLRFKNKKTKMTVGFDPTVRNVIRMAHSKEYSKVFIFNLFPYIHPTSEIAIKCCNEKQKENYDEISTWIMNCSSEEGCKKILIAWGNDLPKKNCDKYEYLKLQKGYLDLFIDKGIKPVCYEWNEEKSFLYHPSPYNNTLTKSSEGKIVRKRKNDGKPSIIQQFIDSDKDFELIKDIYFQKIEKMINKYEKL